MWKWLNIDIDPRFAIPPSSDFKNFIFIPDMSFSYEILKNWKIANPNKTSETNLGYKAKNSYETLCRRSASAWFR